VKYTMFAVKKVKIPDIGLLNRYRLNGAYADCFCVEVLGKVSHQAFIKAFYKTKVFKLERLILRWIVSKPSSDEQVDLLAAGKINAFAAWTVEQRCEDQLLLCDFQGKTRSWLMVEHCLSASENSTKTQTRLYFGSAIVPTKKNKKTSKLSLGLSFDLLLGLHTFYSKVLLGAAKNNLASSQTK